MKPLKCRYKARKGFVGKLRSGKGDSRESSDHEDGEKL
jgi:hypothetical protein